MKLYVEMTDAEYESYKAFKAAPSLTDHDSAELASALLMRIERDGGTKQSIPSPSTPNRETTIAKLRKDNIMISLVIERY